MMKRKNAILLLLALILTLGSLVPTVHAEETEAAVEIHTPEDLMAMAEDPDGSYILMEDLDMAGINWKSLDFSGSFDGNGHAILNLYVTEPGNEKPNSCDGNRKLYETTYYGLFGSLRNAEVKNLKLLNVQCLVDIDSPCFVAGIAGYAEAATITDCTVTGRLELRAYDRMFGVGGVVGYGSGKVENCEINVTLICTDTDATTKDEQFMGGVYATGFMDVRNSEITIDGYVSEHGYVHNGGIVGMYMEYPLGQGQRGYVTGNKVTGKITFFEDNTDRRAYCKAFVGEALVNYYIVDNNTQDFLRDERKDYSKELRPEMCADPVYTERVISGNCDTYGYTEYTCGGCNYSYKDHYTLFAHTVSVWTIKEAPTTEQEGLSIGYCDGCGIELQRVEEKLIPEPTTEETTGAPTETEEPQTAKPDVKPREKRLWPLILSGSVVVICTILLIHMIRENNRRKRRRRRRNGGRFLNQPKSK